MRTEQLKLLMVEPDVCLTQNGIGPARAVSSGKAYTVMVPLPDPWHEPAQVPRLGEPG
jgi:hypothetical protein